MALSNEGHAHRGGHAPEECRVGAHARAHRGEEQAGRADRGACEPQDADTKRKLADRDARVESAILTYKDTKGLTPALKEHLLRHLEADPAGFEALYPAVAQHQQYLLRNVSSVQGGAQHRPAPSQASAPSAPPPQGGLWALTEKYVKDGMPLADAVLRANREHGSRAS